MAIVKGAYSLLSATAVHFIVSSWSYHTHFYPLSWLLLYVQGILLLLRLPAGKGRSDRRYQKDTLRTIHPILRSIP
jgi:hypothetical protein